MGETRLLMLPMADRLLPSSRVRAWQYVALLERAGFSVRAVDRMESRGVVTYGLRVLSELPRADLLFVQKRMLPAGILRLCRAAGTPVVYDFDDAIFCRDDGSPSPREKRFRRCLRAATRVVAGNQYLAAYARALSQNVCVVSSPVSVGPYQERRPADGTLRLVWIGSRSTLPHLQGISGVLAVACREMPGVSLKVIAPERPELPGVRMEFVPWSLELEEEELRGCDVGLMPLPDNAFTRGKCAYKALQCMALGLPVIVSPVGMSCEVVSRGREGWWADSADDWVSAIRTFARAPELVARMGRAAWERANGFSIEKCGRELIAVLRDAAQGERRRAPEAEIRG
jgi:glycosyltransferase involved in cell wall biosynthesis